MRVRNGRLQVWILGLVQLRVALFIMPAAGAFVRAALRRATAGRLEEPRHVL